MWKKILGILLTGVLAFSLAACGNSDERKESGTTAAATEDKAEESTTEKKQTGKALVVYFSWSGNTKTVAEEIQKQTEADIFEIAPKKAYTKDYDELLDIAQEEQQKAARPAISDTVKNFADYETVYVGFPNWWGDMPMILYTFFEEYDFSGKTLVPFVTSGGSGFSNTIDTMKELEPKATIADGLSLSDSEAKDSTSAVSDWLDSLK